MTPKMEMKRRELFDYGLFSQIEKMAGEIDKMGHGSQQHPCADSLKSKLLFNMSASSETTILAGDWSVDTSGGFMGKISDDKHLC